MNAPATIAPAAKDTFLSLDGSTTVEVRHASHPEAVRSFDTDRLRRHFLVESLFRPDAVTLTYSHIVLSSAERCRCRRPCRCRR